MILKTIHIYSNRDYRREPRDGFHGTVKFTSDHGDIELNLPHEFGTQIVALCADKLVEAASAVSKMMTADIVESVPQLSSPTETNDTVTIEEG